jgi:threonyl-tRNA synthetase
LAETHKEKDHNTNAQLDMLRHSTSHVMAQAVQELFPEAKVAIGPSIDKGFYYDFDYAPGFTEEDLARIEGRMKELVKMDIPIVRKMVKKEEAIEMFHKMGESFKVELIEGIGDPEVSLYTQGNFTDLCRGPHLPSTGQIGAFKLLSLAGAYWKGDEKNKMLTRIYGTAFPDESALNNYLQFLEEVKKRDHRRLGRLVPGLLFTIPMEHFFGIYWRILKEKNT